MAEKLTKQEITTRIEELIQEHIGEELEITPQISLEEGLEIDSIERVEIGIKLEKTFGITLADDKIRKSATVGDLIQIVTDATAAVNA
jgi:Acyl carrier protein